jgi:hypothetical protein
VFHGVNFGDIEVFRQACIKFDEDVLVDVEIIEGFGESGKGGGVSQTVC